ncbi:single-stranded DNA-binding protein [Nonomuraea sp. NPDC050643]|uniref:single-stranded DNA-binding protein n=1 Tax=Nonomuraea sp. NPDC050643 TaxID=3155660 RepID=UPI0033D226E5
MNDIYITLTGNVAAEPRQYSFDEGTKVTSLKVLTSHRYFDRKTGQWTDGEKVCFTVRCWRALGENVASSVRAGHPVVVSGKLRIREFGTDGDRRFMPEIEASAVGHDLRWGTGVFSKPERGGGVGSMSKEMRDRLDEETRDWAMGTRNLRGLARPDLSTEDNTVQVLGTAQPSDMENGAASTLQSPEDAATHTPKTAADTATPTPWSMEEGSSPTTRSTKDGTSRAPRSALDNARRKPKTAEGDTIRILGAEDAGTPLPTNTGDTDDEPMTLEERAAA